jgi:hypothetical protein
MPDDPVSQTTSTSRVPSGVMILAAIAALAASGYGLYKFSSYADGKGEALLLSLVVLVGLALVIVLMAGLATVYSILGVENWSQPLALPEGSVRVIIAFSLLLIFVCLATFLYQARRTRKSRQPERSAGSPLFKSRNCGRPSSLSRSLSPSRRPGTAILPPGSGVQLL